MNNQPIQQLPQLIKQSATYKMTIPSKVEEKIRYLIRKFPSTEWSGILFYNYSGSFDDNSLTITCEDIFPMDLGTTGWTEFTIDEDVAAYIAENMELFNCEMGLVHSHHNMGAFFSSQDIKTLQSEGNDTNCFVSLIVDTRGTYQAAITRKVTTQRKATVETLNNSYEFFGEGTKNLNTDNSINTKEISSTVIEYFMFDIQTERINNPLDYLDTRFVEINTKKAARNTRIDNRTNLIIPPKPLEFSFGNDYDNDKLQTVENEEIENIVENWEPSPEIIHKLLTAMITCSLIISDNCDLKQWITHHMEKMYKKIFKADEQRMLWIEFSVEFTISQYPLDDFPNAEDNIDYLESMIASALLAELERYPSNKYIDEYKEVLLRY